MSSSLLASQKLLSTASMPAEKLKKKQKKKKRTKQRSTSFKEKSLRGGDVQHLKATSCPPLIDSTKRTGRSTNKQRPSGDNKMAALNENLRWLSMIALHAPHIPTKSGDFLEDNSRQQKLVESIRTMSETPSDEEERLAVYKMNRRKRYLKERMEVIRKCEEAAAKEALADTSISRTKFQVYDLAQHAQIHAIRPHGNINNVGLSIAT